MIAFNDAMMARFIFLLYIFLQISGTSFLVTGFSSPCKLSNSRKTSMRKHPYNPSLTVPAVSTSSSGDHITENPIRKEGGLFSFNTKYGALNLYGIYYGLLAIGLGFVWYAALVASQLLYFVTRGRVDKNKRLPTFFTHAWGVTLMRLSWGNPKMENRHILKDFFKQKRAAMFVANHASWQDIPYLGSTIGWHNYKMIAKKELLKVPILSKGISVGGHITVDRTNRRDQLYALKKGIEYLKGNVNLCTFPEGTRSRTGRLIKFQGGAFKMASKAGAPIIPLSIVAAQKVHPSHWMFPCRAGHNIAKIIVCDPVETEGKTEEQVEKEVREAMLAVLPEDQRPINEM